MKFQELKEKNERTKALIKERDLKSKQQKMAKVLQYETQKETMENIKKVGQARTLLRPPQLSSEGGSRMSKRNKQPHARTIAQTKTTRNKRVTHQSELPDIHNKDVTLPTESDESPIYQVREEPIDHEDFTNVM